MGLRGLSFMDWSHGVCGPDTHTNASAKMVTAMFTGMEASTGLSSGTGTSTETGAVSVTEAVQGLTQGRTQGVERT